MTAALLALLLPAAADAAQPDLEISSFDAEELANGDLEVSVKIANNGGVHADFIYVDVFGAKAGDWSQESHVTQSSQMVNFLAAGDGMWLTFTLSSDEWINLTPIYATVDVDDWEPEENEGNNIGMLRVLEIDPDEPDVACGLSDQDFPDALDERTDNYNVDFIEDQVDSYLNCKVRAL